MKKNKVLRFKMVYLKFLLKIYSVSKKLLPKFSEILKKHIEKISLINGLKIYDIVKENNFKN